MSATKLYPSASLEPATITEDKLEKKMKEINSFNNSNNNLKKEHLLLRRKS